MKVLRIIFFLLIVFLALPEFMLGVPSLMSGIRAQGDVWSVRHDYFTDAAITLIAGLLAVGFAAWGTFWPGKANWVRLLVAAGIVLMMAISIPGWYTMPKHSAELAVSAKMLELDRAISPWCDENHHYPLTEQELAAALARASVKIDEPSKYQRAGNPIPYELVVTTKATGPVMRPDRPAVLFYAVSSDGSAYWLQGTTLPADVSRTAVSAPTSLNLVAPPPCVLPSPPTPKTPPKK